MLTNKNIIVTGANKGIGKAIVEKCAYNNAYIWACMRTVDDSVREWIKNIEEQNHVTIKIIELDLRNEKSIENAASLILEEKKPINGLGNNAGTTGKDTMFLMNTMEDIRDTFDVNVFGPLYFMQRLLKRMMRYKDSSIVNISSISSFDGEPGRLDYVATKGAINGITRKFALVYGQFGIRVNAVAPGMTKTDGISTISEDLREKILSRSALKRLGEPEEVAELVCYLLSGKSAYITGQIIRIDGGGI